MPEPNLPPLRVLLNGEHAVPDTERDYVNVDYLRRKLPEFPRETREKLVNQYGISPEAAIILVVSISKLVSDYCLVEFCVYNLNSHN
jgi:Asp-tRNA(Asn)/Glu-tRNA(Gln) amidotransferase B subunit